MPTKKRTKKQKPILFNSWTGDFYELGIFCAKANIVQYATRNILKLRQDTSERRIFCLGVQIADECPMSDVAFDVGKLRELTGEAFDEFIRINAGEKVLNELKAAIAEARDWETPEMIAGARVVIGRMAGTDKENLDREEVTA